MRRDYKVVLPKPARNTSGLLPGIRSCVSILTIFHMQCIGLQFVHGPCFERKKRKLCQDLCFAAEGAGCSDSVWLS